MKVVLEVVRPLAQSFELMETGHASVGRGWGMIVFAGAPTVAELTAVAPHNSSAKRRRIQPPPVWVDASALLADVVEQDVTRAQREALDALAASWHEPRSVGCSISCQHTRSCTCMRCHFLVSGVFSSFQLDSCCDGLTSRITPCFVAGQS